MTEKRFTYEQETLAKVNVFDSDGEFICCTLSIWADQLVDKLNALHEENEQLKQQIKKLEAQLYKIEDGVCDICNNMYLVQQGRYFVSKCKKGHDECSKMDLDYCDDFELKDGDVE